MWTPLSLGVFGIFVSSLLLNLIPFMGPSNMVIAGMMGVLFPTIDPFLIGLEVALGSAIAKTTHYCMAYWVKGRLGEEKRRRLERIGNRVGKWGAVMLFVAAATPIPDEPVVIPLGLMRYSPKKFFLVFFSGKIIITLIGAYGGRYLGSVLSAYFDNWVVIGLAAAFTILVTILMLKVDLEKSLKKIKLLRQSP